MTAEIYEGCKSNDKSIDDMLRELMPRCRPKHLEDVPSGETRTVLLEALGVDVNEDGATPYLLFMKRRKVVCVVEKPVEEGLGQL